MQGVWKMTEEREKEIREGLFCWHKAQRDIVREILDALNEARISIEQHRGALGYPVPGNIPQDFTIKNGLADALHAQLTQAQADAAALREALQSLAAYQFAINDNTGAIVKQHCADALTTHTAGAELLKELEGLREKVKTARDEAFEEAANFCNMFISGNGADFAKEIRALKSEVRE
jgi:hypothetical protein